MDTISFVLNMIAVGPLTPSRKVVKLLLNNVRFFYLFIFSSCLVRKTSQISINIRSCYFNASFHDKYSITLALHRRLNISRFSVCIAETAHIGTYHKFYQDFRWVMLFRVIILIMSCTYQEGFFSELFHPLEIMMD